MSRTAVVASRRLIVEIPPILIAEYRHKSWKELVLFNIHVLARPREVLVGDPGYMKMAWFGSDRSDERTAALRDCATKLSAVPNAFGLALPGNIAQSS